MNNASNMQDNNLSRYSYVSVQKHNGHDVSEYFPDSTDKLASEILKARFERLNKHKDFERNQKVEPSEEMVNLGSFQVKEISEIMPISKLRSGLLNQLQLQKSATLQNAANSDSKQQKLKQHQPNQDFELGKIQSSLQNKVEVHTEKSQHSEKVQANHSKQSSKLRQQEQQAEVEAKQHVKSQLEVSLQKPKVNNLINQSIDSHPEKEAKIEASRAISESVSDYIQLGIGKSVNPRSQVRQKQASSQNENLQNAQFQKTPDGMNAVQSKIQPKQSEVYVQERSKQSKSFYEFGLQKKEQTDRQVVQALNDRLNQINYIQEAEINEAISKRISSERNQSSANFQTLMTAQPEKKNIDQPNFVSEFQTDHSEDLRDFNILQHHFKSNSTLLQQQTIQLIELYDRLILEEQCKQLRKQVKDAQLQNRKYKIKLRNASYSKRFNFHSPIPKNNNKPLQFYKKFTVSPNLATQYYDTVQKIADEKKEIAKLQEQYKVICDFQQLMRNKQISSYPPLPFDLEYDNQLGKYKTTKIGFFKRNSLKQLESQAKSKRYEFSKSKRTVKLQEQEINYYDLLNYKRDICRDTILEYEVFNLGRIKKIKDENKLISKEIDFVNQKIEEVSKHVKAVIAKIQGPKELPKSQYFIKSRKSFSRSPIVKSTTRLIAVASPTKLSNHSSEAKLGPKKRISLTKSKEKDIFAKKKQQNHFEKMKPSIVPQLNDDYGLSSIRDVNKQVEQIPTFGKNESQKMLLKEINKQKERVGSPMIRKVNYIKVNKELLTRTELNIKASKSKDKMMSEQISPIKKAKKTFSISADDSKYSNL